MFSLLILTNIHITHLRYSSPFSSGNSFFICASSCVCNRIFKLLNNVTNKFKYIFRNERERWTERDGQKWRDREGETDRQIETDRDPPAIFQALLSQTSFCFQIPWLLMVHLPVKFYKKSKGYATLKWLHGFLYYGDIANSIIKLVYIYNVLTVLFNSHIKVDKKYITIWFYGWLCIWGHITSSSSLAASRNSSTFSFIS